MGSVRVMVFAKDIMLQKGKPFSGITEEESRNIECVKSQPGNKWQKKK